MRWSPNAANSPLTVSPLSRVTSIFWPALSLARLFQLALSPAAPAAFAASIAASVAAQTILTIHHLQRTDGNQK
jgi:hypothetical protein